MNIENPSKVALWAGRVLSALGALFLGVDGIYKLVMNAEAVDASITLGYSASTLYGIGILELVLLAIYLVPRTAVLGAVL